MALMHPRLSSRFILPFTTLVSLGRPGAHGQYVLELLVTTILYLVCVTSFPAIRMKAALVALQLLLLFGYTTMFVLFEEGLWNMAANKSSSRIYPILKSGSGPILSQQGSFALFSRGEIYIQLFHFSMLSRAGLWDQSLFLKEIEKRKFSWVITEFPIEKDPPSYSDWERFTPAMLGITQKLRAKRYRVSLSRLCSAIRSDTVKSKCLESDHD